MERLPEDLRLSGQQHLPSQRLIDWAVNSCLDRERQWTMHLDGGIDLGVEYAD